MDFFKDFDDQNEEARKKREAEKKANDDYKKGINEIERRKIDTNQIQIDFLKMKNPDEQLVIRVKSCPARIRT